MHTKLGGICILWCHNNEGNTGWLGECVKAVETQGFVWWDVGWRIKCDPVAGSIYTTAEKRVTHETSIESVRRQPGRAFVEKVEANWKELRLPFSENDPLHKYLRGESETLTLLKLSEINRLEPPKRLEDFTLRNGQSVRQPPPGFYYITLP